MFLGPPALATYISVSEFEASQLIKGGSAITTGVNMPWLSEMLIWPLSLIIQKNCNINSTREKASAL